MNNNFNSTLLNAARDGNLEEVKLALKNGANVNHREEDQETVLHWASHKGHAEIVLLLLRYKADPNICDKDQRTALHVASLEGNTEIVELLLKYKADPNICDKYQETALHYASRNGQTEIVQFLLKYSADPNVCDKDHQTALLLAIIEDNFEIVQLLLRHNANPNISDKNHLTPLHYAIINKDIFQLLLQSNADPNICNEDQETVLHFASHRGFFMIVQLLLQYNADLNICNKDQRTALHMASRKGHVEIVQLLLQSEAHLNICDKDGSTALHVASHKGHVKIVQLLLEFNADPNICDKDWSTALHVASHKGQTKIVKLLLEFNADPNICDKDQSTALHNASHKGHTEIVNLLLQFNADPNICDKGFHRTPLHLASKKGHTDIILLLLQCNADPNISTKHLWTALYIASKNGYSEIVQILLKANADPNICDENGNTALHHACKGCHTDTVYCLLSHGADQTVKNSEGKTSLDEASSDEIVNLLTKHNLKQILEEVSPPPIPPKTADKKSRPKSFYSSPLIVSEQTNKKARHLSCSQPSVAQKSAKKKDEIKQEAPLQSSNLGETPPIALKSSQKKEKDETKQEGPLSSPNHTKVKHKIAPKPAEKKVEIKQKGVMSSSNPIGVRPPIAPKPAKKLAKCDETVCLSPMELKEDLTSFGPELLPFTELLLKKPKKRHLMMLLDPIKYEWGSIAAKLKVQLGEINSKCFNKAHYDTRRLSLILNDWIEQTKNHEEGCWKTIAAVVEEPPIKNRLIASSIHQFLAILSVQDEYKKTDHVDVSQKLLSSLKESHISWLKEKPNLHDLLMLLCPIKYEWPIIGEQLGVFYDNIKSEDHDVAHDDVQRLNQILEYWINQKTSVVSWESILSILMEPPIKEHDIVITICDFLTKHYGDHEDKPSHAVNPLPALNEVDSKLLNQKPKLLDLCELLHTIKHKWQDIGEQLQVKDSYINMSGDDTINLSKVLLLWINQRPCDEVHWKKIIDTINDPPINNIDLANEICHFLANPHNQKANNISMVLCKEPKQGDLMKVLGPIADKWQNIGEALGMKTDRLKDDASVDDIFLLYTVMRKVLKNSRVTWKTIIDVVRNKPVCSQVVADMIEEFLSRDDVYSRYTS